MTKNRGWKNPGGKRKKARAKKPYPSPKKIAARDKETQRERGKSDER